MTQDSTEEEHEFEVVELESDNGDVEEFVILDRCSIKGKTYVVVALLEDVEAVETMTEEEFKENYGDEGIYDVLRQENNTFIEIEEEEFDAIKDELDKRLGELGGE